MSGKFLYISPNVNGTYNVVNYDASNCEINTFLWRFDVWGSNGNFKYANMNDKPEVWFECNEEFYEFAKTKTFQRAIEKMGSKVVFEFPL